MRQAGPVCGRYAAAKDTKALVEEFEVDEPPKVELPPRYNVAPTTGVYVVRETKSDEHPHRVLDVAHWGLIPSWAKDPAIGNKMINARAETVAEKPSYRRALSSRRCIVPADGFYEWQAQAHGQRGAGKKAPKQPYYLHPADGSSLAMAGLYEWWRNPEVTDEEAPGAWLLSTTILTRDAVDEVGRIHDRMPVPVPRRDWDAWLDPKVPGPEALAEILVPPPPGFWDIYPVATTVNSVRNDGPGLREPIELREPPSGQVEDGLFPGE